jgi:hypothetical protein
LAESGPFNELQRIQIKNSSSAPTRVPGCGPDLSSAFPHSILPSPNPPAAGLSSLDRKRYNTCFCFRKAFALFFHDHARIKPFLWYCIPREGAPVSEVRKIAAILVADVVGYSRLAGADEDRTLSRLRALRSDLSDPPSLDARVDPRRRLRHVLGLLAAKPIYFGGALSGPAAGKSASTSILGKVRATPNRFIPSLRRRTYE